MDPIKLTDKEMAQVNSLSSGPVTYEKLVGMRSGQFERANSYKAFMDALRYTIDYGDEHDKAAFAAANDDLARVKNVTPGAVHNSSTLSNMSVQYANEMYIGEQLVPMVPVDKLEGKYFVYGQRDRFQYPDDELGTRGDANEVDESRSTGTYSCVGYGYQNFLDAQTLANQDAPLNEMIDLQEAILEGLAFRRELRQATLLCTSANYGSNTAAIGAGNRWDTAAGGDPIANIQTGMAALWHGRGPGRVVGFTSLDVYNVLSRHPQILDLFKYNGSSPGLATPDMIARFLGMEGLLVGKARKETANEGDTAAYSRVWSDVFGMVRVADRPSIRNASFAYNFRFMGDEPSQQWFDPSKGVRGGWYAKVAVSEQSKVIAAPTGYLITTPIS